MTTRFCCLLLLGLNTFTVSAQVVRESLPSGEVIRTDFTGNTNGFQQQLAAQRQAERASVLERQTELSQAAVTQAGLEAGKSNTDTNSLGSMALATAPVRPFVPPASWAWQNEKPEIEAVPGGALAKFGPHIVGFASDLNVADAVVMDLPGQMQLHSHIVGLCYYDPDTKQSVWIATLKNCNGEFFSANQVIYRDAFDSVEADVMYTYTRTSLEQDVVIRNQLPSPKEYGLNSQNIRLAVVTEFVDPPTPARTANPIDLRAQMHALGLTGDAMLDNETLAFGGMKIVAGRAFTLGSTDPQVPVGKTWEFQDGRCYLVESTPYALLAPQLSALPTRAVTASAQKVQKFNSLFVGLPTPPRQRATGTLQVAQSTMQSRPGVVLDYLIVTSPLININFGGHTGDKVGFAAIGQTVNDYWNAYYQPGVTPGSIANLLNSLGSSTGVGLTVDNATGIWGNGVSDGPYNAGMYGNFIYANNAGKITVQVSGLAAGTYNFYLYGHTGNWDISAANGNFHLWSGTTDCGIKGTTIWGHGWASTNYEEGQQYVVYRNVAVASGQTVKIESSASSADKALFNGMQIIASDAVPAASPTITELININLGQPGTRVGFAAVGQTAADFWNAAWNPGYTLNNVTGLKNANNVVTPVTLSVRNAPGAWGNGVNDGMYGGFEYPWDSGNMTLVLNNLTAGNYDFYLYAHDSVDAGNALLELWSGMRNAGYKGTGIWGSWWNSTSWEEGQHYIVFRDVVVEAGQPVLIHVKRSEVDNALLNGLQIVNKGAVDANANGLPDAWEKLYFGNLNHTASEDYDGDGLSNYRENQLGTDPTKADTDGNGINDASDSERVWVKTAIPTGGGSSTTYDTWNWVTSWHDGTGWAGGYVYPPSGQSKMHISDNHAGTHQHGFSKAKVVMRPNTGDKLYAWVNLDPTYPPTEVMLQWYVMEENGTASWEHRAYWGANSINSGTDGTASRYNMGALPAAGGWVRLEVPASMFELEGHIIEGVTFTLYGGRAAWGAAGRLIPDMDGNGLEDAWEQANFGHLGVSASADPDGDGMSNLEEFKNGTNPNNGDQNSNTLSDGWEWDHFGNLNQTANADYDKDGLDNVTEFINHTDPNTINFDLTVPASRTKQHNLTGVITLKSGTPSLCSQVILQRSFGEAVRDISAAVWLPYPKNNQINITLPAADGNYEVWVGTKGRADDSTATWQCACVILDATAPALTCDTTGPGSLPGVVHNPSVLVTGHSEEALSKVTYSINSSEEFTGYVINNNYNVAGHKFDSSAFSCMEIGLAPGDNTILIKGYDLAGNVATITKTVNYQIPTSSPSLAVNWPPNNANISGGHFAIAGNVSDSCTSVAVSDENGNLVEAKLDPQNPQRFVAKGIPLLNGTRTYNITASDAAGHKTQSVLVITKSTAEISIQFDPEHATISGSSSVSVTGVTINGIAATMDGNQSWTANGIYPDMSGGLPVILRATIIGNNTTVYAVENEDLAPKIYWSAFSLHSIDNQYDNDELVRSATLDMNWAKTSGGNASYTSWQKDLYLFPGGPEPIHGFTMSGTYNASDVLQSWSCSLPDSPEWATARSNVRNRLVSLGLGADSQGTRWKFGNFQVWSYADVRPVLVQPGPEHIIAWYSSYSHQIQSELFTGGSKGQKDGVVLLFTLNAEQTSYIGFMETPPHKKIAAERDGSPVFSMFGEPMRCVPADPENEDDPKRFVGYLIKAFPAYATVDATPTVSACDWYSSWPDVSRIYVDMDGDANNDGAITDDDLDEFPEDRQPFGVLVCHNNDDDDSNGVPDDEDSILNGPVDFGTLTRIVLRPIGIPEIPGYSCKLVLANPDGGSLDQIVRVFGYNNAGDIVPLLGPGKAEFIFPQRGPGTFMATPADQEVTIWAEGLKAGAGVQVRFQLLGPSGFIAQDVIQLRVFDVDLDVDSDRDGDIDDADDGAEVSSGGCVSLNDDDDNNNSRPDLQEQGTVIGENDLTPIKLQISPSALSTGTITLSPLSGASKVKLWTSSTKGTEIVLPKTWTLGSDSIPGTLYVEGVEASDTERDVMLQLDCQSGAKYWRDTVAMTVVKPDLDIDANADGIIDGSDEQIELSSGGLVRLNEDDDNGNGTLDKSESGTVIGEDDLALIALAHSPSQFTAGTLRLESTAGGSRIKVWTSVDKMSQVVLPKTWMPGGEPVPANLYVEGVETSLAPRDVEVALRYNTGAKQFDDKIRLTTFNLDLDVDTDLDGDIDASDDSQEINPGALVTINGDDDNGNSIADLNESGAITGENDLTAIKLNVLPQAGASGQVTLEALTGANKIKIWNSPTKGAAISLPKVWRLGVDPIPETLYVEGVAPSSINQDVGLQLRLNIGGKSWTDVINLTVVGLCLKEVNFGGSHYSELQSDDTLTTYYAPHWVDNDGNADAAKPALGEHNYSVAYTRNSKPSFGAQFGWLMPPSFTAIKVRAIGTDGIAIPETPAQIVAGKIVLPMTESVTSWPNIVKYYARGDASAFKLSWQFKVRGNLWQDIATSKHQVYLTYADPISTPDTIMHQESLFQITSKAASGQADSSAIIAAVWNEFSDRIVTRVDPVTGRPERDPSGLVYWLPGGNGCVTVAKLLIDGNASCGTWAGFLQACLDIQGIGGHQLAVVNAPILETGNYEQAARDYKSSMGLAGNVYYYSDLTAANNCPSTYVDGDVVLKFESNNGVNDGIFFVKQLVLGASKFVDVPVNNAGFPGSSSPGQGNANARAWFGNHAIVKYGGQYYDPSYGGAVLPSSLAWEDSSLQYYGGLVDIFQYHIVSGSFTELGYKLWNLRPDPKGTQETQITP